MGMRVRFVRRNFPMSNGGESLRLRHAFVNLREREGKFERAEFHESIRALDHDRAPLLLAAMEGDLRPVLHVASAPMVRSSYHADEFRVSAAADSGSS